MVGADGPRSLVRRTLGIDYSGESGVVRDFMGGRMHATYLRAPELYHVIPHDRAWMYWAFNRERRSFMATLDGRERFAFHTQLRPGEDESAAAAAAYFRQALHQWILGLGRRGGAAEQAALTPEQRENLCALGYIQCQ